MTKKAIAVALLSDHIAFSSIVIITIAFLAGWFRVMRQDFPLLPIMLFFSPQVVPIYSYV